MTTLPRLTRIIEREGVIAICADVDGYSSDWSAYWANDR
jgi:hypothetical protein